MSRVLGKGERGGMPDRIVRARANKPAEQRVVVELIQQEPLRADAVECLQQRSQQQLLRRHQWAPFCGVQLTEGGIEPIESLIRQLSNPPERMVRSDPILDRDVREHGAAALLLNTHRRLSECFIFAGFAGFFSELLSVLASDKWNVIMKKRSKPPFKNKLDIASSLCWNMQLYSLQLF